MICFNTKLQNTICNNKKHKIKKKLSFSCVYEIGVMKKKKRPVTSKWIDKIIMMIQENFKPRICWFVLFGKTIEQYYFVLLYII